MPLTFRILQFNVYPDKNVTSGSVRIRKLLGNSLSKCWNWDKQSLILDKHDYYDRGKSIKIIFDF
jgi:hypothetical protein